MPKFRGGDIEKFREWVQKQTKYPEVATINGIHGKVYITFIVENDGSVTNVKVVKGVDPLIDDEAVKAVKSSPKWTPGKQKGVAVRVSYIIILNFQIKIF
jgi:protein TonB